jgi:hypothetical protein
MYWFGSNENEIKYEKEKAYEIQQRMLVTKGRGAVVCTGRSVFYHENGHRGDDLRTDEPRL